VFKETEFPIPRDSYLVACENLTLRVWPATTSRNSQFFAD
jgi:hypothetical protein